MLKLVGVALIALPLASSIVLAEDLKLPPLQKQSTPQAVIDEHFDALNKCDSESHHGAVPSGLSA